MTVSELEHHGVKGQKWGVRKDRGHEGKRATNKKIAKLDKKYEKKASKAYGKVYNATSNELNNRIIPQINNSSKYKGKNLLKDEKLYREYLNDFNKEVNKTIQKHADDIIGTNASGTKKVSYKWNFGEDPFPTFEIVDVNAGRNNLKHADDGSETIKVKFSDLGHVINFTIGDILQQSLYTELEHHGVKGQKWGVRRAIKRAKESHRVSSESRQREREWHETYKKRGEMSTEELRQTVERLRLENQLNKLAIQATASQRAKTKAIMKNFEGVPLDPNGGEEMRKKLAQAAGRAAITAATM